MDAFQAGVIAFAVALFAAFVAWSLRRRSRLPPHLKPYFKNMAELHARFEEGRLARAMRLKELTDPANAAEAAEYLTLTDDEVAGPVFEKAIQLVENNLKDNPSEYGQLLGEIYAFSPAYKNPEKAYYYYYIGLSQDGYNVGFRDENHDPPHYRGPVYDFRNEDPVPDLVISLGWDTIKRIDINAREWLRLNHFEVKEFKGQQNITTD